MLRRIIFKFFSKLDRGGYLRSVSDARYLKMSYYFHTGELLHLENPVTFNEKLQWLKIHDRNPIYTMMVDKLQVKNYIAKEIGSEYVIPLLGVWDRFDDIEFDNLPNQFVLKCTHDSGGLVICKSKAQIDLESSKKLIDTSMSKNYYWVGREWPYKDVKPRIIAETYMEEEEHSEIQGLTDYKFYCFNGCPKFLYVAKSNFIGEKKHDLLSIYDLNWNLMPFQRNDHNPLPYIPKKPINFDKMIEFSRKLSTGIPFVRVDWYEVSGKLYFSEFTFCPGSGYGHLEPQEYNSIVGSWLNI